MMRSRDTGGPPARLRPLALVIDDNPTVRRTVSLLLAQLGFDAMTQDDAADIVAVARRVRPVVIVLDLVLPTTDGATAISQLGGLPDTRDIPIIVISGHDHEIKRVRAMGPLPRIVFLRKPFTVAELRDAVTEVQTSASENAS